MNTIMYNLLRIQGDPKLNSILKFNNIQQEQMRDKYITKYISSVIVNIFKELNKKTSYPRY